MPITSGQQLVYSASAARRLLGAKPSKPCSISVFSNSIWVHLKGQRPTFISKRKFKQHFADWRKQQAATLTVVQWYEDPRWFSVSNPAKGTAYHLDCTADAIDCDCEDYKNQVILLGRGCCKHGYAVLAYFGLSSLREYQTQVDQIIKGSSRQAA